jgi:hypothetical protein
MQGLKVSCKDFVESNDAEFSKLVEELHFDGGFNADKFFVFMKKLAAKNNVLLSDVNEFNYDTYFHNFFKETEKGLS